LNLLRQEQQEATPSKDGVRHVTARRFPLHTTEETVRKTNGKTQEYLGDASRIEIMQVSSMTFPFRETHVI
jgi:hypothetical protein